MTHGRSKANSACRGDPTHLHASEMQAIATRAQTKNAFGRTWLIEARGNDHVALALRLAVTRERQNERVGGGDFHRGRQRREFVHVDRVARAGRVHERARTIVHRVTHRGGASRLQLHAQVRTGTRRTECHTIHYTQPATQVQATSHSSTNNSSNMREHFLAQAQALARQANCKRGPCLHPRLGGESKREQEREQKQALRQGARRGEARRDETRGRYARTHPSSRHWR